MCAALWPRGTLDARHLRQTNDCAERKVCLPEELFAGSRRIAAICRLFAGHTFGSLCSCVSSSVLTKPSRVALVPAIRPVVQMTVGTVLRFAAIVTLAMTVAARSGQPVVHAISKLGRHSIAVFILHRPVIQAFQFAIARVELPASARYVFLYPATIACMVVMCMLRDRHRAVDRMLRAIHL